MRWVWVRIRTFLVAVLVLVANAEQDGETEVDNKKKEERPKVKWAVKLRDKYTWDQLSMVSTREEVASQNLEYSRKRAQNWMENQNARVLWSVNSVLLFESEEGPTCDDKPDSEKEEDEYNFSSLLRWTRDLVNEVVYEKPWCSWASIQTPKVREKREISFSDPYYPNQWHLHSSCDINVIPVWNMGINGTGVTVAMVDDGVEYTNKDLTLNYNPFGSYDFNDNDDDPMPHSFSDNHGTRCAGEISAIPNDKCGVGVAFNSFISGIRLISENPTDAQEYAALVYKGDINMIYSNSWGPTDDGKTVEAPGFLAKDAFQEGVTKGRNGMGSVYIFASGNGAGSGDDCNFDGYANSIYTITIGSVSDGCVSPYYSEGCSALFGVTPSSGGKSSIYTTDINLSCTPSHSGTSASAPIAAGMAALLLSYRPDLTWRDVQHLFVRSTRKVDENNQDWSINGAGFNISYKYGFGLLDTEKMIQIAQSWELIKEQVSTSSKKQNSHATITKGESNPLIIQTMFSSSHYHLPTSIEHVTLTVTIQHTNRGQLEISLISPQGTTSILAPRRSRDRNQEGYDSWTFSTVRCWGENPIGMWQIVMRDFSSTGTGELISWEINLYGTTETHQSRIDEKVVIGLIVGGLSCGIACALVCVFLYYKIVGGVSRNKKVTIKSPNILNDESIQIVEAEEEEEDVFYPDSYELLIKS